MIPLLDTHQHLLLSDRLTYAWADRHTALADRAFTLDDYLALTDAVRVLLIDRIPRLSRARNNEAKRFVTLIDAAYEAKTRLFCSAEAEPEQLYQEGAGAFEFERTASRLREMQSADWLDAR